MRHPAAGELLELHFGEEDAARRDAVAAHARDCADCRALLADVAWVERALATGPEDAPPADGLQRVLARIETVRPARERQSRWLRTAAPCAVAIVGGLLAVHQGGFVAALALFGVGSIVTLSLAPVLILESQRRS
jgi:predicted anti-sigma-YlaC factor YlaD